MPLPAVSYTFHTLTPSLYKEKQSLVDACMIFNTCGDSNTSDSFPFQNRSGFTPVLDKKTLFWFVNSKFLSDSQNVLLENILIAKIF